MKKNVYSLVLSEDVVRAIDACAYREGTNRSALINRILAEYVSYTTPEMRMRRIFEEMQQILPSDGFRMMESSESMLSLRSSLQYKYNPTVRYTVELYRGEGTLGVLRVSLRTQNALLLSLMEAFYSVFCRAEQACVGTCQYQLANGRFSRALTLRVDRNTPEGLYTAEELAAVISRYVSLFDRAIKVFFACAERAEDAYYPILALYRQYLAESSAII